MSRDGGGGSVAHLINPVSNFQTIILPHTKNMNFNGLLHFEEALEDTTVFQKECFPLLHKYTCDGSGCVTEYVWGTCVDLSPGYLYDCRSLSEV